MSIFKTRSFARWVKREGLTDRDLCDAVVEMQKGLIDARLGGGLSRSVLRVRGMESAVVIG